MKLIELIQQCQTPDIVVECARLDAKNGGRPYERCLDALARITPAAPDFTIMLEPWQNLDPEDDGALLNISGIRENDPDRYALELTPWAEWLGAEVRVSRVDLTPTQMVAQCLYEMTFLSFDQDEIQQKFEHLNDMADELREEFGDDKPDQT